jgi:hypothetical protein
MEHLHVSVSFEDGRFTITQQVGSTADDVITIVITADQARQVGKFLLRERGEPAQEAADGFDQFWSAYPRRDGKARALDLWKRHRLSSALPTILAHLSVIKQCPQWLDHGGRYVPHAGTYLSQKRYLDEVAGEDFRLFQ